jgi:hypothetical protein
VRLQNIFSEAEMAIENLIILLLVIVLVAGVRYAIGQYDKRRK